MKRYEIEVELIRDMLGSSPADENIKREYIKSKMTTGRTGVSADIAKQKLDEESVNSLKDKDLQKLLDEVGYVSLTIFYRNKEGNPCVADHQVRGWFKEAFAFLNSQKKYLTKKDKDGGADIAYKDDYSKRWISDRIKFDKRFFDFTKKVTVKDLEIYERSCRAVTAQGPRVSLKSSELLKAGHKFIINMTTTDDVEDDIIKDIFERGEWKGVGAWNNSQWGSFKVAKYKRIK